ncbi:MAG TPA: NYN domain-containing protein [Candidatus Manganitrophaceae bacterium]|nr:NYN domain-containing protein [Candidatus Manganitrophaceae bacterium]
MTILLDGYNFIGRDKGLRGDIPEKRKRLVERLTRYSALSGEPVVVVFDGGDSGNSSQEVSEGEPNGGVHILFSGRDETADDVILRLAEKLRERCLVVSSDRAVQEGAGRVGAAVLYSGQFEARLRSLS